MSSRDTRYRSAAATEHRRAEEYRGIALDLAAALVIHAATPTGSADSGGRPRRGT